MVNGLSGIRIVKKKEYSVCHIDYFSDDIKIAIRDHLTSVCYGPSKASKKRKRYNYKNTLLEFLKRWEAKPRHTKIGMIGELLTHILVIEFFPEYNPVSPYFNLEERSITKGFDIVLFSQGTNALWITEVKSGELHKKKTANETTNALLGEAKRDLKRRLNENDEMYWENAINGATTALDNKNDAKEAVLEILEDIGDEVVDKSADSSDKNVILVTSLFSSLSDEIEEIAVAELTRRIINEKLFNNVLVFSIQKGTYKKVIDFLKEESKL